MNAWFMKWWLVFSFYLDCVAVLFYSYILRDMFLLFSGTLLWVYAFVRLVFNVCLWQVFHAYSTLYWFMTDVCCFVQWNGEWIHFFAKLRNLSKNLQKTTYSTWSVATPKSSITRSGAFYNYRCQHFERWSYLYLYPINDMAFT